MGHSMTSVHNAVATAAAQQCNACSPAALGQARRAHDTQPHPPAAYSNCAPRFEHDFDRLRVHAHGAPAVQPKLFIGANGDRFEREADAVAEQVMRQPQLVGPAASRSVAKSQRSAGAAGGLEALQRQSDSPYSIDDGVVTEAEGEPEGDVAPALQAKPAPGGLTGVAPGLAGRIQALRGSGGVPLPAGVRSFMESRFGHDFGRVRVHTGSRADAAARSIQARAFTLGRDVVFGAGQYAADSNAGRHLIAHELAHVIQQGHAPSRAEAAAGEAQRDADIVRRVQWAPAAATGKASEPWGPGRPKGKLFDAKTDGGSTITTWRPDDGTTYWCHGYTFGGSTAKGGPYSVFGDTVPTVLKDDGWQPTYSCMAQPGDILVFSNAQDQVQHTGIIRQVSSPAGQVDEATSTLQSKWGMAPLNTSSWDTNVKQYGSYRCWSKTPQTGVCATGANEK